jgi:hypothetical protein
MIVDEKLTADQVTKIRELTVEKKAGTSMTQRRPSDLSASSAMSITTVIVRRWLDSGDRVVPQHSRRRPFIDQSGTAAIRAEFDHSNR